MFTCKKIRNDSTYLSMHLSANDYYCEEEQVSGIWVGKGAERLGIAGQAIGKDDVAFEALRLGQHPEGSGKLTPRNVKDSIHFFDFQCAPHKSVSIMAVMMEDTRLYGAHDRSSRAALAELERFAAIQTGQGRRKHFETTGNICAAAFRHDASRELDPQLHTHFVIANATWDTGSQRWLALQTHDIFKAIRYCGKVYQNELARECQNLGYETEMVREAKGMVEGFQIKGVSEELQLRYSKRRAHPLDWTTPQRAEARSYRPGMVVTLTRRAGRLEPGQPPLVVVRVESGRLYFQHCSEPLDPARHADKLQVAMPRQIELASGDSILTRRNARKLWLVNGEVLICTSIQADGSIHTREGKVLPPAFRDFCHGYVVTSHKSQGRTHDQVIVAAQQLDAKAAYVSCSRGRHQASVFTPDKARLFDGVEQSGDRLAASDVLDPVALRPAIWRQQEQRAWQKAVEQALHRHRTTARPEPSLIREPEIRLPEKLIRWPRQPLPSSELEMGP